MMLAEASKLQERGTSKRKGQSKDTLHKNGKNLKWKDIVVSSEPLWDAKYNPDSQHKDSYKKLNSKS